MTEQEKYAEIHTDIETLRAKVATLLRSRESAIIDRYLEDAEIRAERMSQ